MKHAGKLTIRNEEKSFHSVTPPQPKRASSALPRLTDYFPTTACRLVLYSVASSSALITSQISGGLQVQLYLRALRLETPSTDVTHIPVDQLLLWKP